MAKKVTTHTFELKGKDNASKVIGKVKRTTEGFGDSMFKVTGILSNSINIVKGVSTVIGAMGRAVTGSIGATVESFAKFEKGMAEVATITDLSKEEIAGFGVELQELSSKYALDATDATKEKLRARMPTNTSSGFMLFLSYANRRLRVFLSYSSICSYDSIVFASAAKRGCQCEPPR